MNYLKWLICWYNKRHIFTYWQDKDGRNKRICVRCGIIRNNDE